MKLEDLFERRAQSFSDFPDELPNFSDINISRKIGTFDGYMIYGSRFYGSNYDAYAILDAKKKPLAMLVISTRERLVDGYKFQQIEKIWVKNDHQGNGLMTCLLAFLIFKLKTSLSTGELITKEGQKFIRKLVTSKAFVSKVIDGDFIKDIDQVGITKLFAIPNRYQIIFIAENEQHESFNRLSEGSLSDLRLFRGDSYFD